MAVTSKTINELTDRYGAKYALTCGLAQYFPVMNGTSKVYWVDGASGDDTAPGAGQTPDAPLATITKALTLCSADLPHDFIFVWNCSNTDDYPIQISKSFIHIIGAWGLGSPTWIDGDTDDDAAIEFIAGGTNCELANLEFGAGDNYAGIEVSSSGLWGNHIHDCRFGMEMGMGLKYGIAASGNGEMLNWLIEDCRFGDQCSAAGIEIPTSLGGANLVKGTIIRRNIFRVADAAIGINIAKTTANFCDGGIFDNKFSVVPTTNGAAITFGEGTKGMIDGNHAMPKDVETLMTVGTDVPFFCGTEGDAKQSWGINYLCGAPCLAITDYTEGA